MITLTEKAESDLESIFEHYQRVADAATAHRIIQEIFCSLEVLARFQGAGHQSPVAGVREMVMAHVPFVAPYRVEQGAIQVLRVLHQRTRSRGEE